MLKGCLKFGYILLLFSSLFACQAGKNGNDDQLMELKQLIDASLDNHWGGDVIFTITDNVKNAQQTDYILKALYQNDTVGLQISIPNKKVSEVGFGEGIQIKSLGRISDNFLVALSTIYKLKASSATFSTKIDASYIDLQQFAIHTAGKKPTNLSDYQTYKLFLLNSEGDEAEVFLNISAEEKRVELREKDLEYREPLISVFSNEYSEKPSK